MKHYKTSIHGVAIELLVGDITQQAEISAIVNAANAALETGGGVAGAIHRAAGPELAEACRPLAPISPGQAVITEAFNLPNQYVIHCLGPVYGRDKPEAELLANCYINALAVAEENSVSSIAFPAISTGIFGYPLQDAAGVAVNAILGEVSGLEVVKNIRFVLFDSEAFEAHATILKSKI